MALESQYNFIDLDNLNAAENEVQDVENPEMIKKDLEQFGDLEILGTDETGVEPGIQTLLDEHENPDTGLLNQETIKNPALAALVAKINNPDVTLLEQNDFNLDLS